MAVMRPLKALTFLGLSPLVIASTTSITCKNPQTVLARDRSSLQCASFSTGPSSNPISFRLAASFSGKGQRYEPRRDVFHFHPHDGRALARTPPEQRPHSGQDAFFIGDVGADAASGDVAFGVADGVGGWAESGIDPADFSHGLCEYMRIAAATTVAGTKVRPRELMQTAYDATIVDDTIYAGGSTAVVAVGRTDGTLEVAK